MSLSTLELTQCSQHLGHDATVVTAGIASVFYSVYDPRQRAQMPWREAGVYGALCLVQNRHTGAHSFIIFELGSFRMLYSFDLYQGMDYREMHASFHAYETSDGLLGFNFVDARVAHRFFQTVQAKISDASHLYDEAYFNGDGTLKVENLPMAWFRLLSQAGFTEADLQDPSMSGLILSCLEDLGISTQAPRRDLAPADLQRAGVSPREIEQYQRYQAELEAYEEHLKREAKRSPGAPPVPPRDQSAASAAQPIPARGSRRMAANPRYDAARPRPVATPSEALGARPVRQVATPEDAFRDTSKRASLSQRLRRSLSRRNSSQVRRTPPVAPPRTTTPLPSRPSAATPSSPRGPAVAFDMDDADSDVRSRAEEHHSGSRQRVLHAGPTLRRNPDQYKPPAPPAMPLSLNASSAPSRPLVPRVSLLQKSKRDLTAAPPALPKTGRPNFTVQRIRQSVLPDLGQVKQLQQETLVDRLRQGLIERRQRLRVDSQDDDDW